jgi:hypothetical protein
MLLQPRAVDAVGQQVLTELAKSIGTKADIKSNGVGEIWLNAFESSGGQTAMLTNLGAGVAAGWKAKLQSLQPQAAEPAEIA